jgi:hypothetical protein
MRAPRDRSITPVASSAQSAAALVARARVPQHAVLICAAPLFISSLLAFATMPFAAGVARAESTWRLEQPPPPPEAVFKVPLGKVDDLEFYAPNEGLMSVEGNGLVPRGLFFWNGRSWHQLSTVCGGAGEISRIAWASPDEFWVLTEPSEPRIGAGLGLCHFKDGEVVGSYSTPYQSPDPFRTMDAAACDGPDDCWFAGIGSEDPSGQRVGAFHLHWDGSTLTTSYQPQGRGVSALAFFRAPTEAKGTFYESTFVGAAAGDRTDPVHLANPEPEGAVLIHRLEGGSFDDVDFEPVRKALEEAGVPKEGTELLSARADEDELWFAGGGADSGPEAPSEGSMPESVPGPPVAVRYDDGSYEPLLFGAPLFGAEDRFVDISPVPGSARAWVADQAVRERGSVTAKAKVALIGARGEAEPRLFTLPVSGPGRGSAQLIAATGPEEAWMATSAGWLFHYTNGTLLPEDTDPYWAGTITQRPNESVAQFVPDTPPPDDSELFAPPPVAVEPVAKAVAESPVPEMIPALLKDIKVSRRGLKVIVRFKLVRLADVQLVAKRHGRVIASTAKRRLKPGEHDLELSFSRARWPTALSFKTKELTTPKPVPAGSVSNEEPKTGPNVVTTSAHWLTGIDRSLAGW